MGYLQGLKEYLDENYGDSIFQRALESGSPFEIHLHGNRIITAGVKEDLTYDVKLDIQGLGEEVHPKTDIKLLYPEDTSHAVRSLIKADDKVKALSLEPIISPSKRKHIKNKTLYPLMKNTEVVFFTLLEGEVIRGIVSGFSRYEITVSLKGGLPVTILRHSVYDLRNKKGRCFLKSAQEETRDWEKDPLYVKEHENPE